MGVPSVKLNNGRSIPVFGFGTWQPKYGEVIELVKDAIVAGYRHFDCARYYLNESDVGTAIKEEIASGTVKREDLFITSKLWCTSMRPDLVEVSLTNSLRDLQLDYLDLFLIHWPCSLEEEDFSPGRSEPSIFSNVDYIDTWEAMEALVQKGLVRSIGVSNFNKKQLERVLQVATIKPVNNQIECHPYLNQKELIEFCKSKEITVTAYSPLGSPDRPWAKPGEPLLIEEPEIKAIAAKYQKSSAQIILRYLIQSGVIPIPKSTNKKRIEENINIFDFELFSEDVDIIDSLNCNGRVGWLERAIGHPHHPFNDEYQMMCTRNK